MIVLAVDDAQVWGSAPAIPAHRAKRPTPTTSFVLRINPPRRLTWCCAAGRAQAKTGPGLAARRHQHRVNAHPEMTQRVQYCCRASNARMHSGTSVKGPPGGARPYLL